MKKKILMFLCSICFIIPCMFILSACGKNGGVKVSLNLNLPTQLNCVSDAANQILSTNELNIEKGETIKLEDFAENAILSKYFDGWYSGLGANAEKVTNLTTFNEDIELYAKWNTNELEGTQGLKYYYNEFVDRTFVTGYEGTETTIKIPECVIIDNEVHKVNAVSFHQGNNIVEYIEMGENIEIIGDSAFKNFTKLKSIVIPKNVYDIGTAIFEGCSEIRDVRVDINNRYYDSREEDVVVETLTNTLVASIGGIIPDSVRVIGEKVFYNSGLGRHTDIDFPEGMLKIEDEAFYGCDIEYIRFPKSLEVIGNRAFMNCSELKYVDFQENSKIRSLNTSVFENCTSLHTVKGTLKNLVRMGISTFKGCINLESCFIRNDILTNHNLYIGENVTFDIRSAFEGCEKLKIVISNNDTHLDGDLDKYDFIEVVYSTDDTPQSEKFKAKFELAAESDLEGYYKWIKKTN